MDYTETKLNMYKTILEKQLSLLRKQETELFSWWDFFDKNHIDLEELYKKL
jgi:hypothetical protein